MSARSCKIVSFLLPILALALADQLCSVTARAAQRFDITCGKFFADADPPAAVRTKLAERRDVAAQACIDARGNLTRYSPITIVVQLSSGVCMFKQFDFPTAIPDLSGPPVRTINIGTFMTPPLPVCPRQDDPRFYPASGVSEGVFWRFLSWRTPSRRLGRGSMLRLLCREIRCPRHSNDKFRKCVATFCSETRLPDRAIRFVVLVWRKVAPTMHLIYPSTG